MQRKGPKISSLSITPATMEYAKRYGAQYSKEHGWHIVGHVPYELEEFVVRRPRAREYNITVACPKCGGQMTLVNSNSGKLFWGCMLYPRCRGARSEYFVADFRVKTPDSAAIPVKPNVHHDLNVVDLLNLAELAINELGSVDSIERWLTTPQVDLKGKRPIDVIGSPAGMQRLLYLLSRIND